MGSANHKLKAPPTTDPRSVLFYGLPVESGSTLRVNFSSLSMLYSFAFMEDRSGTSSNLTAGFALECEYLIGPICPIAKHTSSHGQEPILTSLQDTLLKIAPNPVLNRPRSIADRSNPKLGAAPFLADSAQNVKNS